MRETIRSGDGSGESRRRASRMPFLSALSRVYPAIRGHLSDPLFRNGYALMANTGVTGLFGVLYWLVAARHYTFGGVG